MRSIVSPRNDRRKDIFDDDTGRYSFPHIHAQVVEQFNWLYYAWCLLDNRD
jgi:hypothetical protein